MTAITDRVAQPALAFWSRWVLANAWGETLGLGLVALLGFALLGLIGGHTGGHGLGLTVAVIALGGLEGLVVGTAQARVLRTALPSLDTRSWVVATVAGAIVAWSLGMAPSTIMSFAPESPAAAGEVPSALLRYGAAAGLGLVAGAVLAVFQVRVLRAHVRSSFAWLPANALAWGIAMPLVFALAHTAGTVRSPVAIVVLAIVTLALVGGLVGAVHGAVLVRLVRSPRGLAV